MVITVVYAYVSALHKEWIADTRCAFKEMKNGCLLNTENKHIQQDKPKAKYCFFFFYVCLSTLPAMCPFFMYFIIVAQENIIS